METSHKKEVESARAPCISVAAAPHSRVYARAGKIYSLFFVNCDDENRTEKNMCAFTGRLNGIRFQSRTHAQK